LLYDRGPDHLAVFERLDNQLFDEPDNLRTALTWTQEEARAGRVEGAARAVEAAQGVNEVLIGRGLLSESRRWLEWMLAVSPEAPTRTRVKALNAAGFVAFSHGEYRTAYGLHQAAVAASRTLADERLLAMSLCYLGTAERGRGALAQAAALLEESLALCRKLEEWWGAGRALRVLSLTAQDQGDDDRALTLAEESVTLCRAHAHIADVNKGMQSLGLIAWRQGQFPRAAALCDEVLAHYVGKWSNSRWFPSASCTLGLAVWRLGEPQRAATLLGDGLRHAWEMGDREWMGVALNYLASIACEQQAYERAARLLGATATLWNELGTAPWPTSRDDHEQSVCTARAALGEQGFAAAFEQGRAMTLDAAVQDALSYAEAVPAADPAREPPTDQRSVPLTPRELDTARLLARGLTNRQIAEALVITEGTASNYVQRVLDRLGFHTRAQVAAWAVERGLHQPSADSAP
jgi:non-specific serine/threonine protein kinase